ncbi:DUF3365 domain-containing protein [Diaphorobacter sp. J5-51]|uniref:Tll0287-like domain-containing protein n=1 Tax=Diaphorobacter sp. J5-51 TaxID=680496 RepID=UPI00069B639C|nr:DUF3365 domain-containing protein [Diaphorobacter sp. J5-51]
MKTTSVPNVLAWVLISLCSANAFADQQSEARQAAAKEALKEVISEITARQKEAVEANGLDGAMKVCQEIAPGVLNRASIKTGWRITRVGTRARNPRTGLPDEWEREGFEQFRRRVIDGESLQGMTRAGVTDHSNGTKQFRFMQAIGTQDACLSCHGPKEKLSSAWKKASAAYPHDRAADYMVGDIRGAFSIIQPMDVPLNP